MASRISKTTTSPICQGSIATVPGPPTAAVYHLNLHLRLPSLQFPT